MILCEKQSLWTFYSLNRKENISRFWRKISTSYKQNLFQAASLRSTHCSSFIHFFILFSQTMTNFHFVLYSVARDVGKNSLVTKHNWTNMKGNVWNKTYLQENKVMFLLHLPGYVLRKWRWITSLYSFMINLNRGKPY